MRKTIENIWKNRTPKFDLAIIAMFFVWIVLGCGGSDSGTETAKKTIPAAYQGTWTGQDGTSIAIRGDGTGDYNAGSSKVNGAAVEVDEAGKTIKFTMLGMDVGKYTIDSPPAGNQMKLSGTTFRRSGGFSPGGDTASSGTASTGAIPSDGELQPIVAQSLQDFSDAVASDDFSDFHKTLATPFAEQFSPAKLGETFAPFVKSKVDLSPKAGSAPTFSPKPSINSDGVLQVEGTYTATSGKSTKFRNKYLQENGEWKLMGIFVTP